SSEGRARRIARTPRDRTRESSRGRTRRDYDKAGNVLVPPFRRPPSGRETLARLLHRRQRVLRLRERARTHGHRRGLRRDRDLLAGGRIASLARLRRLLDADDELNDAADAHLL